MRANSTSPVVAANNTIHNETTPLLARHEQELQTHGFTAKLHSPMTICTMIVIVVLVLQGGDQLIDSPFTRLMESVSCYQYYEKHDPSKLLTDRAGAGPGALHGVAEMWCKVDAVQAEVAIIRNYMMFFEGLPALALAVPFGWLQDRYGRRPFLLLGMFSFLFKAFWLMGVLWFWQTFNDLRWLWVSSLHALLMGGSPVVSSLLYTIVADITTESDRANYFLQMGSFSLLTFFIFPPISAALMAIDPWIPIGIGLLMSIAGALLTFPIPETLGYKTEGEPGTPETHIPAPAEDSAEIQVASSSLPKSILKNLTSGPILGDIRVPLVIAPFLLHVLILTATSLLVQYASKRYSYTVSTATVLVTIRAAVNFIVLFALVPLASKILMDRFGFSGKYKDLFITRFSLAMAAIGWAIIGAAPTSWLFVIGLVVVSLGQGGLLTLRSFLTALVPKDEVARVYSIACVVDTLGNMFGAPLLAQCFELGMSLGGYGIGLPFYILSASSAIFTFILLLVRLRKDECEPTQHPDDD